MKKIHIYTSKDNQKLYRFLIIPYYLLLIGLIFLPMGFIFIDSLQDNNVSGSLFSNSFTFDYHKEFLTNFNFLYILMRSIAISIIVTFFLLLIVYPLAYAISKLSLVWQTFLVILINGTMWINMIIKTQALVQILQFLKNRFQISLLETNFAMILGLIYLFLPFMLLPIYTAIIKINPQYIQAAKDLGANDWQVFKKIIWPLSLPGVVGAVSLVFLQTATNIVAPRYLGPTTQITIAELIENKTLLSGEIKQACAIAIYLSLTMFLLFHLFKKISFEGVRDDA
ncbi:ABC transporter permease [Candidatus Phytoplasma solani]|uniref:ABC transporter permease n=1 Tax=Candidatus Phytoplasma solani TaxID=69896 RepID=UPI0003B7D847|nr:ABC transporter permease [Candidatus Phytoplasma solani]CCP88380.1 Spermidine/putrescine ABC transporter, permease protein [Candidatus Phytoplasma solani]CCP88741.1 Spermidine/putrescine ABC transporter, permease protein [Candidatus Phytoplasma solani]